jgi:hypothetical protein
MPHGVVSTWSYQTADDTIVAVHQCLKRDRRRQPFLVDRAALLMGSSGVEKAVGRPSASISTVGSTSLPAAGVMYSACSPPLVASIGRPRASASVPSYER